jgi:hypothetical protein
VLGIGGSTRGAADELGDRGFERFNGSKLVVINGRCVAQREFFEVSVVQRIHPLATIGAELLVLESGPAIAAGLLRQETSFLVGGIVPRA